jgi:hypothetical protein
MSTVTTRRRFSKEQAAYIACLARMEALRDAKKAEIAAMGLSIGRASTEADIDAYVDAEMAIEASLGIPAVEAKLATLRDALIAWGHDHVKRLPGYTSAIGDMYAKADRLVWVKERLVNLTLKLDAKGGAL